MRIFRHYEDLPAEARGGVVAIGNFDGVHLGHQALINEAGAIARRLGAPLGVLTFEPHPRCVFRPDDPPFRLTPLRAKARHIEALGVDHLYVLHFDLDFSRRPAEDFVDAVLIGGLGARHIVVGRDFVFGHKRGGNVEMLGRLAARKGFGLACVEPVCVGDGGTDGEVISSRTIRKYLRESDVGAAAKRLGRFWELGGKVEKGEMRGRGLGFPTANIAFGEYLRPAAGIYAVRAGVDEGPDTIWRDGVASIGFRPTFGGGELLLEVHLFDFSDDLYAQQLRVAMIEYLRPEVKFDNADDLIGEMKRDAERARAVLAEVDEPMPLENSVAGAR
jgi:riboflavin kinase/FMN adenylyltransferase